MANNNQTLNLSEYSDEFLEKFIDYMAAANSMEKCNAGAIQFIMSKNGEKEYSEKEIKKIWSLIKINLSKKNPDDEFIAGLTKKQAIAKLNEMFKTSKDEKIQLEALNKLTALNNWLDSTDAEEIIKSNNALIETINKTFTQKEIEYLAFEFVDAEIIENSNSETIEDENESIISEIEIL